VISADIVDMAWPQVSLPLGLQIRTAARAHCEGRQVGQGLAASLDVECRKGYNEREMRELLAVIAENRDAWIGTWNDFFGLCDRRYAPGESVVRRWPGSRDPGAKPPSIAAE
jgi:hypothetical protein